MYGSIYSFGEAHIFGASVYGSVFVCVRVRQFVWVTEMKARKNNKSSHNKYRVKYSTVYTTHIHTHTHVTVLSCTANVLWTFTLATHIALIRTSQPTAMSHKKKNTHTLCVRWWKIRSNTKTSKSRHEKKEKKILTYEAHIERVRDRKWDKEGGRKRDKEYRRKKTGERITKQTNLYIQIIWAHAYMCV